MGWRLYLFVLLLLWTWRGIICLAEEDVLRMAARLEAVVKILLGGLGSETSSNLEFQLVGLGT